ncbi:MAG: hypothetical protein IJ882_03860, partial [Paludibacteraceae bacterium]|nr:hypothetical protein [Paludibacteraceae bacterium]
EALLIAFVVSLLLFLALRILPGVLGMDTSVRAYKIVLDIFVTLSVISFIGAIISGIFATDEDKKRMKEAMKELREEEADRKRKKPATVPSPLIELTEGQEKVVIRFLNSLPLQSGHIKTAELKNMLHAMAEKGDLDDSDLDLLADWVEDVTGKEVVKDKFKNEYKDPTRRNGGKESKWEEKIRKEFDKLR